MSLERNFCNHEQFFSSFHSLTPLVTLICFQWGEDVSVFLDSLLKDQEAYNVEKGENLSIDYLSQELENYFLFSGKKNLVFLGIEITKSNVLESIKKYCSRPRQQIMLILITFSKVTFSSIKSFLSKEQGMSLDLSLEKPWDKNKRISFDLVRIINKEGFNCSSFVMQELVNNLGGASRLDLKQEILRIFCNCGKKNVLIFKDIEPFLEKKERGTFWSLRDLILKKKIRGALSLIRFLINDQNEDPFALLSFLKNRMIAGLNFLQRRSGEQKENINFSNEIFLNYSESYIKASIALIFDAEQKLKSNLEKPLFILELLIIQLIYDTASIT